MEATTPSPSAFSTESTGLVDRPPQSLEPVEDLYETTPPVVQPSMSQPPPATRYASVAIDPDQVDPERVQRLDFMERDRTGTASPGVHYLEASQPTTQQYPRPHSLGVKL